MLLSPGGASGGRGGAPWALSLSSSSLSSLSRCSSSPSFRIQWGPSPSSSLEKALPWRRGPRVCEGGISTSPSASAREGADVAAGAAAVAGAAAGAGAVAGDSVVVGASPLRLGLSGGAG